jgi:hypothetical protein
MGGDDASILVLPFAYPFDVRAGLTLFLPHCSSPQTPLLGSNSLISTLKTSALWLFWSHFYFVSFEYMYSHRIIFSSLYL